MSFWKRTPDPEAVPSAVPATTEGGGWWSRLKERVGLNDEPEEIEMAEPTLLQQVQTATTLNRTQVTEPILLFINIIQDAPFDLELALHALSMLMGLNVHDEGKYGCCLYR